MSDSMDGRVIDRASPVASYVKTPTLDALAVDGLNFVRTYAASPQCVPSRTSMLTGRRTDQIRAYSNDNGLTLDPTGAPDEACSRSYGALWCLANGKSQAAHTTFFDALADGGYEVALFGKVDAGANILSRYGPAPTSTGFHGGPSIPIVTRAADIRRPSKPNPLRLTSDWAAHVHPEDWRTHNRCIDWLAAKGVASREPSAARANNVSMGTDRPWFLYCSLNIPHPPFKTNSTWLQSVDEPAVRASQPPWPQLGSMHPHDSYMSTAKGVGDDQPVFTDFQVFKVRRTYYAMVAETDYLLGQVVSACKDAGLYASTLVIFLSDHGEMNMEHRQVWKNSHYEGSLRVPLIIAGGALEFPAATGPSAGRAATSGVVTPASASSRRRATATSGFGNGAAGIAAATLSARVHRGSVVTELVSLLDIYPTLLDIARLPQPGPGLLAGESLGPMLGLVPAVPSDHASAAADPAARARKSYVVSQFHSNLGNTASFCIVQGTLKYIAFGTRSLNATFGGYQPQLFDLSLDPHEMTDVSRTRPADVARLDALLRRELGSGFNAASPGAGDYDEIDAQVKRLQQRTFIDYFVRNTSRLRSLWAQMLRCEDDIHAATDAGEHPLERAYAGDAGTDAPCAANDAPLDRLAAQSFFAAQDSAPSPSRRLADLDLGADLSASISDGTARSFELSEDLAFAGDASDASVLWRTLAEMGPAAPLRQMLARSYTGFDAADWRKLKYWAVQEI